VVAWAFIQGARNWILPWHHASIPETSRLLGFEGLARLHFIRLHNAMLSLLVVPAAFRIGRALGGSLEVGVLSAALTALMPLLGLLSCHALSEWHALIPVAWAFALWLESVQDQQGMDPRRYALLVGLLLGWAFVARPNYRLCWR
jgi:dolichyl-phosphate-mannose--protein O-mannosyl transferase